MSLLFPSALSVKQTYLQSQVLYPGPIFKVYNTILHQYPEDLFRWFEQGGNLFPTTIAVLQLAVLKISRAVRLPPGLFPGLGWLAELPDSFDQPDEHGRRGNLECCFLCRTARRPWSTPARGRAGPSPWSSRPAPPPSIAARASRT